MYQMYAYGKKYDSPVVILLYPRHQLLSEWMAEYLYPPEFSNRVRKVVVSTVDVSEPMGTPKSTTSLRNCLRRLVNKCSPNEKLSGKYFSDPGTG